MVQYSLKYMKKHSRLYLAALLFLCTLIPYLLLGNEQKSEALRFFESFVAPSELVTDEYGLVQFRYDSSFPQDSGLKLKYADSLEFDPYKKVSIDNITMYPQGVQFDATADSNSVPFYLETGCLLLKYMDGIWYQISTCSYGLDPPIFSPNFSTTVTYAPFIFLYFYHQIPFYTLPSGKYFLFISTSLPTEADGKTTGHGAAMVEIDLVNLDGETKRFTKIPIIYSNGDPQVDTEAFPQYSVTVVGETLHHDPYA